MKMKNGLEIDFLEPVYKESRCNSYEWRYDYEPFVTLIIERDSSMSTVRA
jgi:hypothetical protein